MPFYLFQASYKPEAIKAMVAKPHDREAPARALVESLGGKLHHIFFCLGSEDIVALIEGPDDAMMVAGSMALGASGAFSSGKTTKLMTTAEAMTAMAHAQGALGAYVPPTA